LSDAFDFALALVLRNKKPGQKRWDKSVRPHRYMFAHAFSDKIQSD
jgi:hypothetical protein